MQKIYQAARCAEFGAIRSGTGEPRLAKAFPDIAANDSVGVRACKTLIDSKPRICGMNMSTIVRSKAAAPRASRSLALPPAMTTLKPRCPSHVANARRPGGSPSTTSMRRTSAALAMALAMSGAPRLLCRCMTASPNAIGKTRP